MTPRHRHLQGLHGHVWSIAPALRHRLLPVPAPEAVSWSATLSDPHFGALRLTGALRVPPGATTLALLVHGLGGDPDSHYVRQAARELSGAGVATLALALRGADGQGEDIYHAGLVDDLQAALASPELAAFGERHVVGFSIGGHVALRWALQPSDPRVRTVTAVCAPLQLRVAQELLDRGRGAFYRRHVLAGLKRLHAAAAARQRTPHPHAVVRACRTFYRWDELVVVPRYGFAGVHDYYARMSVGERLGALALPSLLVLAAADPMVPPSTVAPFLPAPGRSLLDVRWSERGGHLGFPGDLDLGLGPVHGLMGQVRGFWLRHV